ncbi:MAG: ComEC/Rec2 family competence protein [Ktedonobacterales bacterium]
MTTPAIKTTGVAATISRPLFGGYLLVALVAAWLAGIAFSAMGIFALIDPLTWLIISVGGVFVVGVGWAIRRWLRPISARLIGRWVLIAGLLLLWLALGAARAAWSDPARDPLSVGRDATGYSYQLQGDVVEEPDVRDGYRFLTVQVTLLSYNGGSTWTSASGRVEATVYGPDDWFAPAYGDTVQLTGKLQPISGYAPPGVVARMPSARASILSRDGGNPLLTWLFAARVALAGAIQRTLPEPEAALLIGILLGLKSPTLRARLPLFTATGTIHLVVPAGLKVAVLAELASRAARRLGRWPGTFAALCAVTTYAALGGGGPAAIRAAIMGALLALAPALGRVYNVFTALALAVLLMTLYEPLLIYDAGFQLTALATFGLPLLVPPIRSWLLRWFGPLWRRTGAGTIAELLATTLAAQIATLPVLALTFHEISLIAPLANLLTVPLLAPLLVLGGLLALLATLAGALTGPLAAVVGVLALLAAWIVWPLLWFVDAVITLCAGLPLAALAVTNAPALLAALGVLLYYGTLIAAYVGIPRLARRLRLRRPVPAQPATMGARATPVTHAPLGRMALIAVLALALLGSCGATLPALAAERVAHLDFLSVGPGGEATVLRLPSGVVALIDGGPSGPALEAALGGELPFWQRKIDLVALTDPRSGMTRGLEDAASHFTIGQAVDPGMLHPTVEYIAWLDAMRRAEASHTLVRQDDILHLDNQTTLTALAPPQQLYPPNGGASTVSDDLILRLDTPGLRVLFLGAADAYALDALAGSGEPLAADVVELALPQGAALDLSGPLGDVLAHPRVVIITNAPKVSGKTIETGDPWAPDSDAEAVLGAQVYRVSTAGTISLSGDANGWSLGG